MGTYTLDDWRAELVWAQEQRDFAVRAKVAPEKLAELNGLVDDLSRIVARREAAATTQAPAS